ncbi:MAG: haloacid dehalogenase [Gammaproteobacteria bacterium]|nr:haloacid dehalogenase [Gammaproteobacteria bacterium]
MSLESTDAVLFDFDGTLAPNLDLADMRRQVVELTVAAGIPEDVYAGLYIVEVIEAGAAWLATQNSAEATLYQQRAHQLILDIELNAARSTQVFPGIKNMLTQLRNSDIKIGIVTRNCRAAIETIFPDRELFVDALHARDDVAHIKPDPRHLLANLQALKARPDSSIMVGDGALDMQAGKALNMHCIGVLTGSNDSAALQKAGANQVLANCISLHEILI